MNNYKKIGISALAGSLAMVSANALEYTMGGELASTFTSAKGNTTAEAGKGFGTETDLTFTATGELENGWTVTSFMGVDTATNLTNSSSQVTIGMGSLGTIRLNHIGGSSANGMDDVMPNAYQETWDGLSDGTNPSFFGAATASGSIEYRMPEMESNGMTVNASILYDPSSSGANTVRGVGTDAVSGNAYTATASHEIGISAGVGYETVDDSQGITTAGAGNTSASTGYIKYAYGPITLGYQQAYNNLRHGGAIAEAGDSEATMSAIAYTAGNLTVSYGESELKTVAVSNTASTSIDLDSIQAAYVMGAMTISAAISETANSGGVAGATHEENTLAVSFAF